MFARRRWCAGRQLPRLSFAGVGRRGSTAIAFVVGRSTALLVVAVRRRGQLDQVSVWLLHVGHRGMLGECRVTVWRCLCDEQFACTKVINRGMRHCDFVGRQTRANLGAIVSAHTNNWTNPAIARWDHFLRVRWLRCKWNCERNATPNVVRMTRQSHMMNRTTKYLGDVLCEVMRGQMCARSDRRSLEQAAPTIVHCYTQVVCHYWLAEGCAAAGGCAISGRQNRALMRNWFQSSACAQ